MERWEVVWGTVTGLSTDWILQAWLVQSFQIWFTLLLSSPPSSVTAMVSCHIVWICCFAGPQRGPNLSHFSGRKWSLRSLNFWRDLNSTLSPATLEPHGEPGESQPGLFLRPFHSVPGLDCSLRDRDVFSSTDQRRWNLEKSPRRAGHHALSAHCIERQPFQFPNILLQGKVGSGSLCRR